MGAGPTCEFPVPLLGIGMAQAVHFRQAGIGGVALVDPELLDVLPAPGDQRAETGQPLGLFQQGALFQVRMGTVRSRPPLVQLALRCR